MTESDRTDHHPGESPSGTSDEPESSPTARAGSRPSAPAEGVKRRQLLRAAGTATVLGAVAGCSDQDATPATDEEPTTDQTTDATTEDETTVAGDGDGDAVEATPFGLSDDGMAILNQDAVGVTSETTTLAIESGDGEDERPITRHVASYPVSEGADVGASNLLVNDTGSRGLTVHAEPALSEGGDPRNPRATEPLSELLRGPFVRQVLTETGVAPREGFEWAPREEPLATGSIGMLGTEGRLASFVGALGGVEDIEGYVVLHVARVVTADDDLVLLAGAHRQNESGACIATTDGDIEVSTACIEANREFVEVGSLELEPCPPALQRYGHDLCPSNPDDDDSVPPSERPRIELDKIRLVQALDNCRVGDSPGWSVSNVQHDEPNPDVVVGDNATVRFELANLEHLENLPSDVEVMVQVYHQGPGVNPDTYTFDLAARDVRDIESGTHTVAKLHDLANNDSDPSNDPAVFTVPDDLEFVLLTIEPLNSDVITDGDRIVVNVTPPTDRELVDLDPLKVGFVQIQDPGEGSNYGSGPAGSGGFPRDYDRSINSAYAYLQRNFPGEIVAYRVDDTHINGKDASTKNAVYKDAKNAKKLLDKMASFGGTGFLQSLGTMYADSRTDDQAESLLASEGFDVVCAIIPWNDSSNGSATDYYSYHGSSGTFGKYMSQQAAVNSIGAGDNSQDDWAITTIAQEVAHYLQSGYDTPSGRPMARRKQGGSVDTAHARASKSWDDPAVWTTAYDLTDGTFSVLEYSEFRDGTVTFNGPGASDAEIRQVESYMSRSTSHERKWTDARIFQDIVDRAQGGGGSASAGPVLSGIGLPTAEGLVRYEEVHAYDGWIADFDNPHDVAPSVEVELLDPTGGVLQAVAVPDHLEPTHGDDPEPLVSFTVPFPDATVEVRTTAEGGETRMNPIVRSVRDALERVNERGLIEPAETRAQVADLLEEVRAAMAEGVYADAATVMERDVGGLLDERLVEHESAGNEPSREELLDIVADMARRLRVAAERADAASAT